MSWTVGGECNKTELKYPFNIQTRTCTDSCTKHRPGLSHLDLFLCKGNLVSFPILDTVFFFFYWEQIIHFCWLNCSVLMKFNVIRLWVEYNITMWVLCNDTKQTLIKMKLQFYTHLAKSKSYQTQWHLLLNQHASDLLTLLSLLTYFF